MAFRIVETVPTSSDVLKSQPTNAQINNSAAKRLKSVSHKVGTAMAPKIVRMDQMSPTPVALLIVQKIISNVTIQNVCTNLLCVMVKMTVVMAVTNRPSMPVAHPTLSANLDFGLVRDSLMFALKKPRSVMTNQIAQMELMRVLCAIMQIVIITEDSALMGVSKPLLGHFVHARKERC